MERKAVSGIMLTLLLLSMLTLLFNVQPAKASGTICIRADGSVDPPTAPISSVDNVTYTFTDNIYDSIVIERDNIVVDGAGYTVQGTGSGTGIDLSDRNNVTLKNVEVTNFDYGIVLNSSSNNTLVGNTASSNNNFGIYLNSSSNNDLFSNTASDKFYGIYLDSSSYNNLTGNTASSNDMHGIILEYSSNNTLTGNTASSNGNHGISLGRSSNNTLTGNTASNNTAGIWLSWPSNNNVLSGNTASNNYYGIILSSSSNNTLSGNTISNGNHGIILEYSSNNTLTGNTASSNDHCGIHVYESSNNVLFHNNIIDNTVQASVTTGSVNIWDDGYPSGGNFWSDYTGVDVKSGPNQGQPGSNGIGDTPYIIDADNQDNYPLMRPISFFNAGTWNEITYYVAISSNSTVSNFNFSQPDKLTSFNVTGADGTTGFCRITIPNVLLGGPYTILVNNSPPSTLNEMSDDTHTFLYFTYNHSTKTVQVIGTEVIPEFPTWTPMLLLLIVLTVAMVIYKRRLVKTPIH